MSYHSQEFVDHIAFVPPLALRRLSAEERGAARLQDALPFGLPFDLSAAYLDHVRRRTFPCGRLSCFPFHAPPLAACDAYSFEPAFIQKRNERERHRVRCVNEGYARLRDHLPHGLEDKRLSKVETLRAAIDYIKHLQSLLSPGMEGGMEGDARRRTESGSDGDSRTGETIY